MTWDLDQIIFGKGQQRRRKCWAERIQLYMTIDLAKLSQCNDLDGTEGGKAEIPIDLGILIRRLFPEETCFVAKIEHWLSNEQFHKDCDLGARSRNGSEYLV